MNESERQWQSIDHVSAVQWRRLVFFFLNIWRTGFNQKTNDASYQIRPSFNRCINKMQIFCCTDVRVLLLFFFFFQIIILNLNDLLLILNLIHALTYDALIEFQKLSAPIIWSWNNHILLITLILRILHSPKFCKKGRSKNKQVCDNSVLNSLTLTCDTINSPFEMKNKMKCFLNHWLMIILNNIVIFPAPKIPLIIKHRTHFVVVVVAVVAVVRFNTKWY